MKFYYSCLFLLVFIGCNKSPKIHHLVDCHDVRKEGGFVIDYYVVTDFSSEEEMDILKEIISEYNQDLKEVDILGIDNYTRVFYKESTDTPIDFSCDIEHKKKNRIETFAEHRLVQVSWKGGISNPYYIFYDGNGFVKGTFYEGKFREK